MLTGPWVASTPRCLLVCVRARLRVCVPKIKYHLAYQQFIRCYTTTGLESGDERSTYNLSEVCRGCKWIRAHRDRSQGKKINGSSTEIIKEAVWNLSWLACLTSCTHPLAHHLRRVINCFAQRTKENGCGLIVFFSRPPTPLRPLSLWRFLKVRIWIKIRGDKPFITITVCVCDLECEQPNQFISTVFLTALTGVFKPPADEMLLCWKRVHHNNSG